MKPIPDYAYHMTREEFVECVNHGFFINYDGSGVYATATEMSDEPAIPSEIILGVINTDFTHVAWFNK